MSSYIPLVVVSGKTEEGKPNSSIANLLPGTLCQIFAMLLRDTYGQNLEYGYQVSTRYNFAQVCRAWREIALAEPSLWRYLDFRGTKWTKLLVQRSQVANLHVNARACRATIIRKGVPDERFNSMLSVLPSNLWRLEELVLEYIPLAQTVQLLSGPEDKTPYPLQHLDLMTTRPARADDQDAVDSFIRRCHNLRSLRLTGLEMYKWGAPLPSSLTSLDLRGQPRPSTKELLTTLGGLPRLQELGIRGCGPIATEDDPPFTSPYTINFPFLQHLVLQDVNMATESYYRYLNIPSTANIKIICQITPAQPSPQRMLEYLAERFQAQDLPWPTLRRAHLLHYRGTFQLTLLPTVPEAKEADFENPRFSNLWQECFDATSGLTSTKFVRIKFEWHSGQTSWSAFPEDVCAPFFAQIHQGLPLHHLQCLYLMSITDLLPSEGMDELVTGLQQLVLLGVHAPGSSWWSCLIRNENRALGNSKSDPELNQKPSSLLPLPKLSRLVIMLDENMIKKENESVILQAYEWISSRARSSGKLRVLEFNFFTKSIPPPTILFEFEPFADVFIIPTV